jgi:mono/diheme cytochrome c family protein
MNTKHPLHIFVGLLTLGTLALGGVAGMAEDKAAVNDMPTPEQVEFFETKVRPVLHDNCFACHNDKSQQGGIRLDSMAAMLKGNSGGPTIIPGDPDKSPLIHVVHYDGKVKMPPSGKLKPEEIQALADWIKMGAPWPGVKKSDLLKMPKTAEEFSEAARKHWAFQPIRKPQPPQVKNTAWVRTPIDQFILAKLEAKKLTPAPRADRRTLIRRATFDLIGLPPTQEEINAFVNDKSPDAWEKVIDRLLASPHYGERWGRHWLDIARYADTKGYVFTEDINYYNAYTYRDWVVRAFNEDLPYDQFLIKQLAADRLPQTDDRRDLAAAGFLSLGRKFIGDNNLVNDDMIDVVTRGTMGLTVTCARCHDHKFDPIPTKDYYSLFSVFNNTVVSDPPPIISPKEVREPFEAHRTKLNKATADREWQIRDQINRLRDIGMKTPDKQPEPVRKTLQELRPGQLPNGGQYNIILPHFTPEATAKIAELDKTIAALKAEPVTPVEFGVGIQDRAQVIGQKVHIRGNPGNQGAEVQRQFLAILSPKDRKPFSNGSGRLELAQSIANKDNPLTARVLVNRVWMYHFGQAIVRTPGDFGLRGEKPTHPQLLDWLAATFMQQGWSHKKLHRLIMLSSAYQMSSAQNPKGFAVDPENRLVYKQNQQRLDLEAFRDSLLAATGQLDRKLGGKAEEITRPPYSKRRTVYAYIDRNNIKALFRTFDFANPDMSSPTRPNTTVPQQALFLMNSGFVVDQARALADEVSKAQVSPRTIKLKNGKTETESADAARVRLVYGKLFGRQPTASEIALGESYVKQAVEPRPNQAWSYGYGTVNAQTRKLDGFTPLTHFANNQYQAAAKFPDPSAFSYLLLNAQGGHPGRNPAHAAVRRWTAPYDTVVSIKGVLNHPVKEGNGVRGRVVSSREGVLAEWTVHYRQEATEFDAVKVKKGETLDFVVDNNGDENSDSFTWSPIITEAKQGAVTVANRKPQVWNAVSDFLPPSKSPANADTLWSRYIHALLMTNEFAFVD